MPTGRARVSETLGEREAALKRALAPVEPPVELEKRLELTLDSIVELAADELENWELAGLRDPRNWPRAALGPTAAVVVGGGAAVGLVLLRTQRRRPKRRPAARGARDPPAGPVRDVAREALRVLDDLAPGRGSECARRAQRSLWMCGRSPMKTWCR